MDLILDNVNVFIFNYFNVRPRTVEDWGNRFNFTFNMMATGILALKAKGAKVNLSYGKNGLYPTQGGGWWIQVKLLSMLDCLHKE